MRALTLAVVVLFGCDVVPMVDAGAPLARDSGSIFDGGLVRADAGQAGGAGGGFGGGGSDVDGGFGGFGGGTPTLLNAPVGSRSSGLARVNNLVLVLNPDEALLVGTIDGIDAIALLSLGAGSEPEVMSCASLVRKCWVALRKTGVLVEVAVSPQGVLTELRRVTVGSEPTAVATSPNGTIAVAATFGEDSVAIVTSTGVTHVDVGGHPRGVSFTNNGDSSDADELVWVSLFYGEQTLLGLVGTLVSVDPATASVRDTVHIAGSGCEVNQLSHVHAAQGSVYVAFECTHPSATAMQPKVDTGLAKLDVVTKRVTVQTMEQLVLVALPDPADLQVRADDAGHQEVTVLSRATSSWVTLSYNPGAMTGTGVGGQACNAYDPTAMPLFPCQTPPPPAGFIGQPTGGVGYGTGLAGLPTALLRSDFNISIFDRAASMLNLGLSPISLGLRPTLPTSNELSERSGRLHFHTALGRWSTRASFVSCASCHPDGLSDGVTWRFAAGPRQTIALNGTFAKGNPADHRVQNWTGVADEVSDVEGLVRGFMGGKGALTMGTTGMMGAEQRLVLDEGTGPLVTRNDGLSGSSMKLSETASLTHDWEAIDFWAQHVRSPAAPTQVDAMSVQRGRAVFASAGCDTCHAGPKWTVSRVPWTPSPANNGSAIGARGTAPTVATGLRTQPRTTGALPFASANVNVDTLRVDVEHVPAADGGVDVIGPERVTCVLRNVGTWSASNAVEVTTSQTPSQGALGFNVPSLLGVATSAPYLHHGLAPTLEVLLSSQFSTHLSLGNAAFAPTPGDQTDLVAFVRSIDDTTPTFVVPAGYDICE